MKKSFKHISVVFSALAFMFVAMQCTEPEETMSWRAGNGLHILGSTEVAAGSSASYYVDGFTVDEEYTWTLNGNPVTPTRGGEFVSVMFPAAGDYTLKVSNGKLEGELKIASTD